MCWLNSPSWIVFLFLQGVVIVRMRNPNSWKLLKRLPRKLIKLSPRLTALRIAVRLSNLTFVSGRVRFKMKKKDKWIGLGYLWIHCNYIRSPAFNQMRLVMSCHITNLKHFSKQICVINKEWTAIQPSSTTDMVLLLLNTTAKELRQTFCLSWSRLPTPSHLINQTANRMTSETNFNVMFCISKLSFKLSFQIRQWPNDSDTFTKNSVEFIRCTRRYKRLVRQIYDHVRSKLQPQIYPWFRSLFCLYANKSTGK